MKKLSSRMIIFSVIIVASAILFTIMINDAGKYHQGEELLLPTAEQNACLHCHISGYEEGVWTPISRWVSFGLMGLIFLFGITRNLSVWKTRETWHQRFIRPLGKTVAIFFLIQILAGLLLVIFAKPMPEALLDTPVSFEYIIRVIHWGSGIILLISTLAFSYVGSQAPWDQKSFWATIFWVELIGSIFAISELSLAYLRADWVISLTANRLYALHLLLLPVMIASIIGVYFIVLRKQEIQ